MTSDNHWKRCSHPIIHGLNLLVTESVNWIPLWNHSNMTTWWSSCRTHLQVLIWLYNTTAWHCHDVSREAQHLPEGENSRRQGSSCWRPLSQLVTSDIRSDEGSCWNPSRFLPQTVLLYFKSNQIYYKYKMARTITDFYLGIQIRSKCIYLSVPHSSGRLTHLSHTSWQLTPKLEELSQLSVLYLRTGTFTVSPTPSCLPRRFYNHSFFRSFSPRLVQRGLPAPIPVPDGRRDHPTNNGCPIRRQSQQFSVPTARPALSCSSCSAVTRR